MFDKSRTRMNKVSPFIRACSTVLTRHGNVNKAVKVKLVRIKCHPLSVQAPLFKLDRNVNKAIKVKLIRIKCHPLSVQAQLFKLDREM